jgi:hypothetical protein
MITHHSPTDLLATPVSSQFRRVGATPCTCIVFRKRTRTLPPHRTCRLEGVCNPHHFSYTLQLELTLHIQPNSSWVL